MISTMNRRLLALSIAVCLGSLAACLGGGGGETRATDAPPAAAKAAIANSYCYVCHINYREEKLASRHDKAGVRCATCHGDSENHSSDEDGLTPPEIMVPRDRVNLSCMTCHPAAKLAPRKEHAEVLAPAPAVKVLCTDCHGQGHRLKVRTRVWDKATGRLISDDGVRMMGAPPGAARDR